MTKPTKWVCAQRRLRSAWASAQSDQSLPCQHKKAWVLIYPLRAQRILRSDWADAQADLSLRWAHSHFVGFVMSRLKWYFKLLSVLSFLFVFLCLIWNRAYELMLFKIKFLFSWKTMTDCVHLIMTIPISFVDKPNQVRKAHKLNQPPNRLFVISVILS